MIEKGIYKHYKGRTYEVLDVVRHSETLEYMVLYKALYDDFSLWVRPLTMFLETIEMNGQHFKRFELQSSEVRQ